ncbi:hypothetical protein EJ04DRAFT_514291 [Polyplosphaeria fusca]|uniref:RelA/SpoT domain-containing protein n=1 Tax=Polyplosphaeria fusca TaxID=682080 RepID=A0A9P4QUZ3_9PLEO|nr:hypothetical protein EJ04DRAFT_514291 [Polyplosphaeria fusca]
MTGEASSSMGPPATPALVPAATWINEIPVPPIVDNFLKQAFARSHYKAMAEEVQGILDKKLKEAGIQFKLSARAKDRQSLREKLIMRCREMDSVEKGKCYKDFQQIKKEIVDLAGVRIILYMPTKEDNLRVKHIIQKEWGQEVKAKRHPPQRVIGPEDDDEDEDEHPKRRKYQPRHLGYRAIHYRIPMKDDEGKGYGWMEGDQVEVQVVSALTHAWAEVGHDILYKSYAFGPPSIEEERTLDALNGLIQSGDLLLEQFQEMVIKRTSLPFKHREQLTTFLRSYWDCGEDEHGESGDYEQAKFPRGESIYILFKFLEKERLNSPMAIRRSLTQLQYPYQHVDKEKLVFIGFSPIPKVASDMSVVICLIRDLLKEKPYMAPTQVRTGQDMCAVMMSALTILQYSLGSAEQAKNYLQRTTMTQEEIDSLNFVLTDRKRHVLLEGGRDEQVVNCQLKAAWDWFRTGAHNPKSFCGFLFRLAEMGCRKELDPVAQLNQLDIGPLSRSCTEDVVGESGPSARDLEVANRLV